MITGTLLQFVTTGQVPDLDEHRRPKVFFGNTIHDRCYRRPFYDQGKFAKSFDDEGARNGWCLYELGCKGPTTYNACATIKWNGGASFPIESGHGCIGCSEPGFLGQGQLLLRRCPPPRGARRARSPRARCSELAAGAAAAGVVLGRGVRRREPPASTRHANSAPTTNRRGAELMDLLGFARGPALKVALAIFCLGVAWRIVGFALLRLRRDLNKPRASVLKCLTGGLVTVGSRSWPHPEFIARTGAGEALGYSYHIGLFIVVLLFTPHIVFLGSLFGFTWPGLPSSLITVISVLTLTLVSGGAVSARDQSGDAHAVEFRRLLQLVHHHAGDASRDSPPPPTSARRTRRCSAVHILSVDVLLIWFPFGKLMHAFYIFPSRAINGALLARKGAAS